MRSSTILFSLAVVWLSFFTSLASVSAVSYSQPSYSADSISPTPPAHISAVAKLSPMPEVVLSWSQAYDNIGVTRYNIYRNGTYLFSPSGVGISYRDTTVTPGQTYTYSVQSGDGAGNNSAQSDTIAIVVKEGGTSQATTSYVSPAAPTTSTTFQETSVYANTGQNGQFDTVEAPRAVQLTSLGTVLQLGWRNPSEAQFKSVRVIKKANAFPVGIHDGVIICDGTLETCVDTNVVPGVTYYYGVYAVNTSYLASKLILVSGALVPKETVPDSAVTKSKVSAPTAVTPRSSPVVVPTPTVGNFTRTLTLGSTGEDVLQLQKFLNTHGFVIAITGPGSAGNETDYFGKGTQKAVQAYQCKRGIVCDGDSTSTGYGLVGKMTRGSLNKE